MSVASLIHIGEVAALLLVAYVVGCAIGYGVRRLTLRRPVVAVVTTVAAADETPDPSVLFAPPVVAPVDAHQPTEIVAATAEPQLAAGPPPKVSAIESLKSLSATMPLLPPEPVTPEPAVVAERPVIAAKPAEPGVVTEMAAFAGATDAAKRLVEEALKPAAVAPIVARPAVVAPLAPVAKPAVAPIAEMPAVEPPVAVEPPIADPEPAAPDAVDIVPPLPASLPGQAWAGEIHGHLAAPPEPVPADLSNAAGPALPSVEDAVAAALIASIEQSIAVMRPGEKARVVSPPPPEPAPPIEASVLDSLEPLVAVEPHAPASQPEAVAFTPVSEPVAPIEPEPELATAASVPEPAIVEPEPEAASSYPPPQEPVEFDEDAAMRAIEGGWSRRQTRAMPDAPEIADVGAAVSAAQVAVEKILARNGVPPDRQVAAGKPKGLARPRDDRADNLRRINGLSGLDESTLNNLGIFHFDQIAAWDQKEVLWLENHAFARGRIGREAWQEQARAFAAENNPLRASR